MTFTSPIHGTSGTFATLDGNAPANRTAISGSIPVALPAGGEILLKWYDINDTGNDHAFAIDDLSVSLQSSGQYAVSPASLSLSSVDTADAIGARQRTTTLTATADTTVSAVNYAGNAAWTLTSPTVPFTVSAGTSISLVFTYAPTVNDGSTQATTATLVTADNSPGSSVISLTGSTVVETTIAAFKTAAEGGTAGSTVYKITGYVNSNNLQTPQRSFNMQDLINGSSATRGICVFDSPSTYVNSGTIPAIGSNVSVYGTALFFGGLLEIVPTRAFATNSTGATITPVAVDGSDLSDATESVLLVINDAVVPIGSHTAPANIGPLDESDATTFSMRLVTSTAITYVGEGVAYALTGIGAQTATSGNPLTGGGGYNIQPRFSSEVPVEISAFEID